jgi:hypothetical protein
MHRKRREREEKEKYGVNFDLVHEEEEMLCDAMLKG